MKKDLIAIGKIHAVYGVKGNLKFEIFIKNFYLPEEIYIKDEENELQPLNIETVDRKKGLIKFKNYDTPEKAKEISHKLIYIPEELLPKLGEDEFYEFQLIGMDIYYNDKLIGKVEKIDDRLSQAYLIIKCTDEKTRHLPFINEFVKDVKVEENKMQITPQEGWFSL
jgi:16S rRNA processing protein RimM